MKIGIVTDFYYPWIGGPAEVVRHLSQGLAARGHAVSLLAPSPHGHAELEREGQVEVQRAHTSPLPFGFGVRVAVSPLPTAGEWLTRTKPDVVHVHHPFPLSAAALVLARRRGIPAVMTNHTVPECSLWGLRNTGPLYRVAYVLMAAWLRYVLRRCHAVATPTPTAARMLQSLGFTGPVTPISNGVDVIEFQPGEPCQVLREELGIDGRPAVLYTGRLDPEKAMDVWLRAAGEAASGCNAQFLIGGRGVDRDRLEGLARHLELDDRVRFLGYLDREKYKQLYRLADVYCIAAPVELQSLSTLEAIASGLPVVAVDAGALPELVRDGVNGYLVPPGNSRAMGRALVSLVSDPAKRARMGAASRRLALEHALDRTIDRYESFLLTAAARAAGGTKIERASAGGY